MRKASEGNQCDAGLIFLCGGVVVATCVVMFLDTLNLANKIIGRLHSRALMQALTSLRFSAKTLSFFHCDIPDLVIYLVTNIDHI